MRTRCEWRWLSIGAAAAMILGGWGCSGKSTPTTAPDKPLRPVNAMSTEPAAAPMAPSTVLADVDGTTMTAGDTDTQIRRMLGHMASLTPEQVEQLMPRYRQQMVDQFIVRTLLQHEADRRKIETTPADITNALAEVEANLPPGMTLSNALERERVTMAEFHSNLVAEIRLKKTVEAACPVPEPSEAEVEAFYKAETNRFSVPETVRARHILLKVDADATAEAKAAVKKHAEALQADLAAGKLDFAKTATKLSDDPGSKARGGELMPFMRGQMVKPFEDAAFSQAPNVVGPVIETQYGYHILEVLGHESARAKPLAEVKAQIRNYLKIQAQKVKFEVFLESLRKKAIIKGALANAPVKAVADEP